MCSCLPFIGFLLLFKDCIASPEHVTLNVTIPVDDIIIPAGFLNADGGNWTFSIISVTAECESTHTFEHTPMDDACTHAFGNSSLAASNPSEIRTFSATCPGSYFCYNAYTGAVYSTSALQVSSQRPGDVYTFRIVASLSTDVRRMRNITVVANLVNPSCSDWTRLSTQVLEHSCTSFKPVRMTNSPSPGDWLLFEVPPNTLLAIGFELVTFSPFDGHTDAFQLQFTIDEKLTWRSNIALLASAQKLRVDVPINQARTVKVKFHQLDNDGKLIVGAERVTSLTMDVIMIPHDLECSDVCKELGSTVDGRTAFTCSDDQWITGLRFCSALQYEAQLSATIWNFTWSGGNETLLKQTLQDSIQDEVLLLFRAPDTAMPRTALIAVKVKNFTQGLNYTVVLFNVTYGSEQAPPLQDPVRQKFCGLLETMQSTSRIGRLAVSYVVFSSSDCCLSKTVKMDNSTSSSVYTLNTTISSNRLFTIPCQIVSMHRNPKWNSSTSLNASSYVATTQCVQARTQAKWTALDLSKCAAPQPLEGILKNLKENITEDNVEDISERLLKAVEEDEVDSTEELLEIADTMDRILNITSTNPTIVDGIFSLVSTILDISIDVIAESESRFQTSEKLNDLIETVAKSQQKNYTGTVKIEKRNLAFLAHRVDSVDGISISSPVSVSRMSLNLSNGNLDSNLARNSDANVYLPNSVFNTSEEGGSFVYAIAMANNKLFLTEKEKADRQNRTSLSQLTVASMIMSVTVGKESKVDLKENIEMIFKVRKLNISGHVGCFYWNESAGANATSVRGRWRSNGCKRVATDDPASVKCECNHLTNFALLLDPSQTGSNPLSLKIVTWIGCGLSMAGLAITIVTYTFFKNLRKSLPSKVLICFCWSLLATLVTFLAAVDKTQPRIGCQITAILIQYFILTTFFWMSVQAVNLYRSFVSIFNSKTQSDRKFLITASLYAWGLPMVIVGVTFASRSEFYGPQTPNDIQLCLVRGIPFYYSLLMPATFILACNFTVLALVVYNIQHTSSNVTKKSVESDKASFIRANLRIAFTLAMLLGCTWLFAVLAIGDLRDVFQWLFCIFNSLQGFFIFIFYAVTKPDAAREWRKFFGLSSGKDSSNTSQNFMKSTGTAHDTKMGDTKL